MLEFGTSGVEKTRAQPERASPSDAQVDLGTVIEDKHQGTAHAADDVSEETLVEALCQAFLRGNLLEAVHGALVKMLLHRLLGLHLQPSAHSVERVGGPRADGDCGLSCA